LKVLVGNKSDLNEERKVEKEQAESLAKEHNLKYFEISAKENNGIEEVMNYMMSTICKKGIIREADKGSFTLREPVNNNA